MTEITRADIDAWVHREEQWGDVHRKPYYHAIRRALTERDQIVRELVELLEDIEDHTLYMMENHGYDRGWYDADSNLEKRLKIAVTKAKAALGDV